MKKLTLALFALGALMRLYNIHAAPLWYDENFTLILARLPWERMIQATAGDVHPPLYYAVIWLLYHAAPNAPAWASRIPSALMSLAALVVFYNLTAPLAPRPRVIALALMALLPFQIWYAQEARMYAMLELLVLLAWWSGITRRWIVFAVCAIALPYTQNYGLIYIAVIAVILMLTDRHNIPPVLVSGAASLALYMPWAFTVAAQIGEINGRYWIMDGGAAAVLIALYKLFWAASMTAPGTIASYIVTFTALIYGVAFALARKQYTTLTLGFAPVLIAFFAGIIWQPILLFRPLIGVSPFLYILTAHGLDAFIAASKPRAALTAALTVPVFAMGVYGYYANIAAMKAPGAVSSLEAVLASTVREQWQPGDVLYYADDGPMINLLPYAANLPQFKMPTCPEEVTGFAPVLGSLSASTRAAIGVPEAEFDSLPYTRAWVFAPRSPLHPECYDQRIAQIAPEGQEYILVDDNEYLSSGVWLIYNDHANK